MNDKLLFLGLLYFVQGIPYGLQSSLLPVYLRGAGQSLTRISLAKILYFPWVLKVLWAPLVDRAGTKRRWLATTVGGLALVCLAGATLSPEQQQGGVAAVLLAMNLLVSVQDVAVDGAAVKLLRGASELGLGNTAQVVGYKAGSVFAGGGLLAVIDVVGWAWTFTLLSCVYGGVALFVCGVNVLDGEAGRAMGEAKRSARDTVRPWAYWRKLLDVPGTKWTMLYVLTYKLGEQGAITMFPLFLLDHHMTSRELGLWNGVVAMAFSICGSSLGGFLLSKYRISQINLKFISTSSHMFLLRFTGMAVLSLSIQHFIAGLITTLTFTCMMHCTQRAEESIQATHYSFLATLEVLGKLCFSALAGAIVDTVGFPIAFLLFLFLTSSSALHVWRAMDTGVLKEQLREQPQ
ncbi:Major facilitator superfamily domain-containing protein 3 [Bagarius yarrelli]|uniref:Major facilitator superfamily domain-containing protein 3 n=1 Tax=Bagarius yarrelli TaxID=175774 RepID=A0A556V0R0_BAGYA|nr:Major facilitator superfamily domain-containing protein 3 [Bagarius yarrelli]